MNIVTREEPEMIYLYSIIIIIIGIIILTTH